jgi:hypothetical protein
VVLRYAGFLSTFAAVLFTVMPSNHCQTILVMVQLGNILVMISSGLIFGYRVTALWAGNKGINILIGSMYTIMIICWVCSPLGLYSIQFLTNIQVVVSTQAHAINGPPAFIGSNCQLLPLVPWAPLSYATCFVYNAVILMLTIRKIPLQTKSPVGYLLFRDSLVYFVCTTITNLVVLAIQSFSANLNLNQMKPTATPFATLITTAVGCRLFLNLKMLNQGKEAMTPSATIGSFQSPPAIAEKFHGKPLALLGRGKSSPKQLMRRASDESFATSYESDAKITRPMSTASYDSTYETVVDHDYDTRKLPQIHSRQSIPQDIYLSNKGYEHEDDVLLNNDDLHRSRV